MGCWKRKGLGAVSEVRDGLLVCAISLRGDSRRGPPGSGHGSRLDAFDEDDLLVAVDFAELNFDDLALGGGDGASDEGGLDGELAVAAIDEDEELDAAGAPVVEEGVESGADGASGVEDVVDEDDIASVDVEAEGTGVDDGADVAGREVVAIEADVEGTGIDGVFFDAADQGGEALGDGDAAALDADESDGGRAVIFLDDLMSQANEGALNFGGGHNPALLAQNGRSSDCF